MQTNPGVHHGAAQSGLRASLLALLLLMTASADAAPPLCPPPGGGTNPRVAVVTTQGTIHIELLSDRAPCTVENFLNYVARGDFDGSFLHRSVPGFIIQAGGFRYSGAAYERIPPDSPVANEFDPALEPVNLRGTVAMAKLGGDPDSATNQWFINLADNSAILDPQNGGFTVFGQVDAADMAVADAIAALPILDGRFAMSTNERGAFSSLPLASSVQEDPGGYGCFDFSFDAGFSFPVTGALFSFALGVRGDFVADPASGGPIFISPGCLGASAAGTCTGSVSPVAVYDFRNPEPIFVNDPPTPLGWNMSCDEVEASDVSLAARVAHVDPQVPERLVVLQQVTVVPEPVPSALQASALLALVALMRFRSRLCPD